MIEKPVLTIRHYKQPLKEVEKGVGFGYYGAILGTEDGWEVQCHECGELFRNLGTHVCQKHMPVREYREKYQLSKLTALVSEKERERMKESTLNWLSGMSEIELADLKNKAIEKRKEYVDKHGDPTPSGWKKSLEAKNKEGTCPDQLLDHIKKLHAKLGRTPTLVDLIEDSNGSQRYKHLIRATFGSWTNALKMIGLTPSKQVPFIRTRNYEREELLEYLRIYYEEHGRIPTSTDCRRALIPSEGAYIRAFGSLPKARALAGIPT